MGIFVYLIFPTILTIYVFGKLFFEPEEKEREVEFLIVSKTIEVCGIKDNAKQNDCNVYVCPYSIIGIE